MWWFDADGCAVRYVKWLVKKYLYKKGMRDFQWIVAGGKRSYKLKYYNHEDLKSTAASETLAPEEAEVCEIRVS